MNKIELTDEEKLIAGKAISFLGQEKMCMFIRNEVLLTGKQKDEMLDEIKFISKLTDKFK